MKHTRSALIISFFCGLLVTNLCAQDTAEESTIKSRNKSYQTRVGEPHPDFVFPDIKTGKPTKLSDFRGKKVLLVHFASW